MPIDPHTRKPEAERRRRVRRTVPLLGACVHTFSAGVFLVLDWHLEAAASLAAIPVFAVVDQLQRCLLYTSDAADE